jgi:hypothetical protein
MRRVEEESMGRRRNARPVLANGTRVRVRDGGVCGLPYHVMVGAGEVVGYGTRWPGQGGGPYYKVRGTITGYGHPLKWNCHATHVEPVVDEQPAHDPVSRPEHYDWHPSKVQCADITGAFSFNLGNVIKYVWRAGRKDGNPVLQDLRKAAWYLQREIDRLEKAGGEKEDM